MRLTNIYVWSFQVQRICQPPLFPFVFLYLTLMPKIRADLRVQAFTLATFLMHARK